MRLAPLSVYESLAEDPGRRIGRPQLREVNVFEQGDHISSAQSQAECSRQNGRLARYLTWDGKKVTAGGGGTRLRLLTSVLYGSLRK